VKEFSSLIEFVIDVLCLVPPIKSNLFEEVPKSIFLVLGLVIVGAISCTVFYILLKDVFGKAIALGLSICVSILSFGFIGFNEWETLFSTFYTGMIVLIRGLEGVVIGSTFKPKIWMWIILTLLILTIILFILVNPINPKFLTVFVTLWIVANSFFVGIRSWIYINSQSPFEGQLTTVLIIILISITLIYVSTSTINQAIYVGIFPIGFVLGVLLRKKNILT